ncbi:MAG TPA: hypothetical protein VGD77_15640 [Gemmatimonadaceae bacterium]
MVTNAPSSRRDFLRGLFGRAANATRDGLLPEGLLPSGTPGASSSAAGAAASPTLAVPAAPPRAPTPDELARAFALPRGQEALGEALVCAGRLLRAPDGRVTEPAFAHRLTLPAMGAATERWLDRAREGRPLDPTRPQDAILLHAARAELGL